MPETPGQTLDRLIAEQGWQAVEFSWLLGPTKAVMIVDSVSLARVPTQDKPKELQEVNRG